MLDEQQSKQDEAARRAVLRKVSWRLLPLLGLGYGIAYMDRANIGYAALQMTKDLRFSATVYGLGGGLFFLSYALLEVPSNIMLARLGARRWIARIMISWGVLATVMMFVKTPVQFHVLRFLLGAAEAGFFPGVLFYLTLWFPAFERGRAVSRFYIAMPLSAVVMGAAAGALLGLQGKLGLAGWQWLFLVEGLPAILLGIAVFFVLPSNPGEAKWLAPSERALLESGLAADKRAPGMLADHGTWAVLRDPWMWLLGLCNVCIIGGYYAFTLSAPVVLRDATHWDATRIGLLMAAVAVLGAIAMIAAGAYSDRARERHRHLMFYLLVEAAAYAAMGLAASPMAVIAAYTVSVVAFMAIQAVLWHIPGDILQGRAAAAGFAAMGSIGMLGAFIGPWLFGVARDHSGGYQFGLVVLFVPYVLAALMVGALRRMPARGPRG